MHARRQTPRSILVISLGGLGDFVSRWPLWQSLRGSFPRARISYLGDLRHACLLVHAGLCDEIMDFSEARWARPRSLPAHFELTVSVLGVRGNAWLERVRGEDGGEVWNIEPFPAEGVEMTVAEHIGAQAGSRGLTEPAAVHMALPNGIRARAAVQMREQGLLKERVVAIHPGSGGNGKNWPMDKFRELAAELVSREFGVLVLEGEAERGGDRRGGIDSWGASTAVVSEERLPYVAGLLERCDWYVGNDSGISHLAAILDVPTTVLFGPTDACRWAPAGRSVRVIKSEVDCAPCSHENMSRCMDRTCLNNINVEEVLSTIGGER